MWAKIAFLGRPTSRLATSLCKRPLAATLALLSGGFQTCGRVPRGSPADAPSISFGMMRPVAAFRAGNSAAARFPALPTMNKSESTQDHFTAMFSDGSDSA
jgi:hypothetical protein